MLFVRSLPRRNENPLAHVRHELIDDLSEAYLEGMKTQEPSDNGGLNRRVRSLPRRNENIDIKRPL